MKKWNYLFDVPDFRKIRMIVHTDCKNEADDQFALAHHLMTPKFIVKGIIAGHFNINPREYGVGNTASASLDEVNRVLELMDVVGICPVIKGAEVPLPNEQTPVDSPGARFIIEEAMKEDDKPLFIAMQGAITDLAAAILIEPRICEKMTAIWIGGGNYPEGGQEFNLMNDITAANVVMNSSMNLWQVPMNAYKQLAVSLAELQDRVMPYGKIGNYLFTQMVEFNNNCKLEHWPHGEIWGLGDNPTISLLLEESERTDSYEMITAPTISYEDMRYDFTKANRQIRVYKNVDSRIAMEDFYAKLKINYPETDS